MLQAEFCLTQMLDRPVAGRIFFEQVLHDNLDIGRPDQVSLVFDRRIRRKGRHPTPVPHPGHHRRGGPRPCTSTTRTPRSSSTTRKEERFGPRPQDNRLYDGRALEHFTDRAALEAALVRGRLLTADAVAEYLRVRRSDSTT